MRWSHHFSIERNNKLILANFILQINFFLHEIYFMIIEIKITYLSYVLAKFRNSNDFRENSSPLCFFDYLNMDIIFPNCFLLIKRTAIISIMWIGVKNAANSIHSFEFKLISFSLASNIIFQLFFVFLFFPLRNHIIPNEFPRMKIL